MSFKNNNITINLGNKNTNNIKQKHTIVIAYQPKKLGKINTSGTLVLHINITDNNPTKYTIADLINMYLSNEIDGQEIWGTYYQLDSVIFPVFYCKKPVGQVMLEMEGQSATIDQPWFPLNEWNIDDPIYKFISNTIALND